MLKYIIVPLVLSNTYTFVSYFDPDNDYAHSSKC